MPSISDALERAERIQQLKTQDVEIQSIADVIFTGTTYSYALRVLRDSGAFRNVVGRNLVHFSNSLGEALSIANNRAGKYQDDPLVLVVDSHQLSNPRREGIQKDIICEEVPTTAILGAYLVGDITENDLMFIDNAIELLESKGKKVEF